MAIAQDILTAKVQRLMLSDKQKERLIKELNEVSEEKLKLLAILIREHDDEALEILSEKTAEQEKVKDELRGSNPHPIPEAPFAIGDEQKLADVLEVCFKDPKRMAEFLNVVDDNFLHRLEEVFDQLLEDDKKAREEFKRFFREVRLQKSSFEHEKDVAYKEALIESIAEDQKYSANLDDLIKKAEKLLQAEEQK